LRGKKNRNFIGTYWELEGKQNIEISLEHIGNLRGNKI
jgi:hypothetical protein